MLSLIAQYPPSPSPTTIVTGGGTAMTGNPDLGLVLFLIALLLVVGLGSVWQARKRLSFPD